MTYDDLMHETMQAADELILTIMIIFDNLMYEYMFI